MASSSTTTQAPPSPPPYHPLLLPSHGTTAAPPPTPSTASTTVSDHSPADALSSLLSRLPTSLSLPSSRFSRRPSTTTTKPTLPTISISGHNSDVLSAAITDHGFFQLTHHNLTTQLVQSAESDSASLFALTSSEKRRLFPSNWPLGYDDNNDDDEEPTSLHNASFCISDHRRLSSELSMGSLAEQTQQLEALALQVVELIACALGFENPFGKNGSAKPGPLMWVSKCEESGSTRCYPYAVGLKYQIREREYRLETDTGPVLVKPEVGSVLVTVGDILQVWSNGKAKKVRGQPVPILTSDEDSISMTLLMSLPLETTISPLLPITTSKIIDGDDNEEEKRVVKFQTIPFEDYAWRVYHQRLFFKDTLDRYRVLED